MTAVIGLLLMLLSVTDGVVTYCDGRQSSVQCYGALGGSVSIQLIDNFSQLYTNEETPNTNYMILICKKEKCKTVSSVFPSNGTVLIHNLSRTDSDERILMIYNTDGHNLLTKTIQLFVQAPVSSVSLVSECLSQGEMKVSCSSEEGDSPQYKWTLNGKSLTEAELLSGNEQANIITLKQHVSGRLVCSVWNHVSSTSKEINIRTCGFIYINCTFNGTKISKWVLKENNTLCVEPTTVSPTETHSTVGFIYKNCTFNGTKISKCVFKENSTLCVEPTTVPPTETHNTVDSSMLRCSLMFLFSVVSFVGIAVYFKWKKIKSEKDEQSAEKRTAKFSVDLSGNEEALYCNI